MSQRGSSQGGDWDEFLSDCRENITEIRDPTECEAWKYLRPPNISSFASGKHQLVDDKKILEEAVDTVWILDSTQGYVEAKVESRKNGKVVVSNFDTEMTEVRFQ